MSRNRGFERAIPPSELLAVGEITRAWNIPCIDRVPDDDVQAFLC